MQTKQQIEQLLAGAGVSPNKRLGQHFLIDLNLIRLLINTAGIRKDDVVLEVGCGTGSFTEPLAAVAGKVVTVEYDSTLAGIAAKQLARADNVSIINTDILESKNRLCREVVAEIEKARGEFAGRLMLVANLPYNVSSAVMMNLIAGPTIADLMYVTVQKEVAQRMTAGAGSDSYGTLSILMEAAGKAKILRKLGPSVFWPVPQVNSAMVSFSRQKEKIERIHDFGFFRETVSLFMGHRRKMLKACVKFSEGRLAKVHSWHDIFERAFVDPHHRPEDLSTEEYISIANLCVEQIR